MSINSTDAQWDTVVRELFWDTSCVDPKRHVDTITSSSITCTECIGTTGETRQFMSVKALLCHQRTKHGLGIQCVFSVMMTCKEMRVQCRDVCDGGTVTKLCNERVEELDELGRDARTAARQSGHSHVIAQLPAVSSNGRVVGRLTV